MKKCLKIQILRAKKLPQAKRKDPRPVIFFSVAKKSLEDFEKAKFFKIKVKYRKNENVQEKIASLIPTWKKKGWVDDGFVLKTKLGNYYILNSYPVSLF